MATTYEMTSCAQQAVQMTLPQCSCIYAQRNAWAEKKWVGPMKSGVVPPPFACLNTMACQLERMWQRPSPPPAPTVIPLPAPPCKLDEQGVCIEFLELNCSNPDCPHRVGSRAFRARMKAWREAKKVRRDLHFANVAAAKERRMKQAWRRRAIKYWEYLYEEMQQAEAAWPWVAPSRFEEQPTRPSTAVGPSGGMPNSGRMEKKRTPLSAYERAPVYGPTTAPLPPSPSPIRSVMLLTKLRALIRRCRSTAEECARYIERLGHVVSDVQQVEMGVDALEEIEMVPVRTKWHVTESMEEIPLMHAEMMDPELDPEPAVIEDRASNVVVQDAVAPIVAEKTDGFKFHAKFCETEVTEYPHELDRWFDLGTIEWKTTDAAETSLFSSIFPAKAIVGSDNTFQNSVIANIVRIRQYFKTDLEFKVVLNSSPFAVGQCQVYWFYRPDLDAQIADRNNRFTISQMHHAILDAASAEAVILKVPYKNYKNYLNVRKFLDCDDNLNMGLFGIKVLNQLGMPEGSSTTMNGQVFIKFPNARLMGMVPPNFATQPPATEMLPALAATAALNYVSQKFAEPNRDNPSNPTSSQHLVPMVTNSIAAGKNYVEPIHAMRLDPSGQTPHPDFYEDEMTVKHITSKWGLIGTIQLKNSYGNGYKLECFDAAPIASKSFYNSKTKDGTYIYNVPPVAVISSMFAYWRGTLELRLDCVATQYHQARLLVTWVPHYLQDITYADAANLGGVFFDLKAGNRSITVPIPFISDTPWWPRAYSSGVVADVQQPPSKICIFVVNRLIYTNAVKNVIDINVYMRGGEDFEVSVPSQPVFGLSFNSVIKDNTNYINYAKQGYYPWYVGTWSSVEGGKAAVLRWGSLTQQIAQFENNEPKKFMYYRFRDDVVAKTLKWQADYAGDKILDGTSCWFVPVDVGDGNNAIYMGVCSALKYVRDFYYMKDAAGKWVPRATPNYDALSKVTKTSDNTFYASVQNAILLASKCDPPPIKLPKTEGNAEDNTNPVSFEQGPSGFPGSSTFGESFTDLKDLMRRYQNYALIKFDPSELKTVFGTVLRHVPILPQGLALTPKDSNIDNYLRDGQIPIILSAFRFFRGGLRFKVVANGPSVNYFYVQHKPDRIFKSDTVDDKLTINDSLYNQGYASSVQNTNVNMIDTIEIPYYLPGPFGLLQRPKLGSPQQCRRHMSLGDLAIGLTYDSKEGIAKDAVLALMYKVADDFRAYTFQGFPPMLLISEAKGVNPKTTTVEELPRVRPLYPASLSDLDVDNLDSEMGIWNKGKDIYRSHLVPSFSKMKDAAMHNVETIQEKMVKSAVGDFDEKKLITVIKSVIETVDEEKLKKVISAILEEVLQDKSVQKAVRQAQVLSRFTEDLIFGVGLSLVQGNFFYLACMIFRNIADLLDLNIFFTTGLIVATARIMEAVSKERTKTIKTEAYESQVDDGVSILTAIWQAIAIGLDIKKSQPSNIRELAGNLFSSINYQSRGSRGLLTFFKNLIHSVKSLFNYAYRKVVGLTPLHEIVQDDKDIMVTWSEEALKLISPSVREKTMNDINYYIRLEICHSVGKYLYSALLKGDKIKAASSFVQLFNKVETLLNEATNVGINSQFRQEPVSIWIAGKAGIGKTHLKDKLLAMLMEAFGENPSPCNTYVYNPGLKHMDGIKGKKAFIEDDFGILSGEQMDAEIGIIHRLVSDARFVPEQAHLENKGAPATPVLVLVCSNESHPVTNSLQDPASFYRRRDIVLKFELKEKYASKYQNIANVRAKEQISEEATEENPYPHLKFSFIDPMQKDVIFDDLHDLEYPQMNEMLKVLAMRHYKDKKMVYLKKLREFSPEVSDNGPLEETLLKIIDGSLAGHGLTVKDPSGFKAKMCNLYGLSRDAILNLPSNIRNMFSAPEPTELRTQMGDPNQTEEPKQSTSKEALTTDNTNQNITAPLGEDVPLTAVDLIMRKLDTMNDRMLRMELHEKFKGDTVDYVPDGVKSSKLPANLKALVENKKDGKVKFCLHSYDWVCMLSESYQGHTDVVDANGKVLLDKIKCTKDCMLKSESFYADMCILLGEFNPSIEILMKYAEALGVFDRFKKFKVTVKETREGIKNLVKQIKEEVKIPKVAKFLFYAVGGLTLLLGIVTLVDRYYNWGWICNKKDIGPNGEVIDSISKVKKFVRERFDRSGKVETAAYGEGKTKQPKNQQGVAVKELSSEQAPNQHMVQTEETGYESEAGRVIENIVDKNLCYLLVSGRHRNAEKYVNNFQMRCFGIVNNYVLMLNHYRIFMHELEITNLSFVNYNCTVRIPLVFNKLNFKVFKESELCLLELPLQVPRFPDVRKHFISQESTQYAPTNFYALEKSIGSQMCVFELRGSIQSELKYCHEDMTFVIPQAIVYNWHNPGRCMSVIVCKNKSDYKIVGFHIAGGSGTGIAEPVVRETFDALTVDITRPPLGSEMFKLDGNPAITLNTNLTPIGVVKDNLAHRPAEKSMIKPSMIHGYLPVRTAPNPLTVRDTGGLFSPLVTGVDKHGKPPLGFDPALLKRAQQELLEQTILHTIPQRQDIGVLDEGKAILGIEGLDGYESMELSTSEGFPYFASRPVGARNKRYQFEITEHDNGTRSVKIVDPVLRQRLDSNTKLRRAGVCAPTVFVDCLKDYRNPIQKNKKEGCTRIFSISPTDFTIQFRQWFMDFLAATKVCRFQNEHMVGINVNGLEWTKLARVLQTKGPKLLCGDYSGFGPSLDSEVVHAVGEVWIRWYEAHGASEQDSRIRRCLIEELRHSFHLVKNFIYQTWCGSPSGAPCTVNINSDCGRLYIYMAWLDCWKDVAMMCSFVAMRKHIVIFVYGDDLIINVSDFAVEKFNNEFLQNFFARHGLKYTDETKGETIRKWTDISEASFLKNQFIRHEYRYGIYTAGLNKQSIEECANWVQAGSDWEGASKQTSCDAVMLAYGWGREYFNAFRSKILDAWSQVPMTSPLTLYSYEEMDWMRFGYFGQEIHEELDNLMEKERRWREQNKEMMVLAQEVSPIQFY